jgi:ribonuclease D
MKKEINKDEINLLPLYSFGESIVIASNEMQINHALEHLSKCSIVGFDTESKPVYKKGQFNHVSLVQLALNDTVYLLRIAKTGLVPALVRFFEDESIAKVGIAIEDDLNALQKRNAFRPAAFYDLNRIAEQHGFKNIGAKNLTAMVLGLRISKRQQRSNWENARLTDGQIAYAATDAWICQAIYRRFIDAGIVENR